MDLNLSILITIINSEDDVDLIVLAALIKGRRGDEKKGRCGSVQGHRVIWRDRVQGHDRLYRDYFGNEPVFPPNLFRRRFRMCRDLFIRIQTAVETHDSYFIQKKSATCIIGLSSLQKTIASFRMLSTGVSADCVDEYVRIGESTAIECLKRFVKAIVEIFSDEYLRSPNEGDIARLLTVGERRGFPRMLGSIDCMHWKWKNCPTAWKGMYIGHCHEPTIILEVVASYDLWIWHAFFVLPGSHDDINSLDRSPLFSNLVEGCVPPVSYSINGHKYSMGYYLADGIYPPWAAFVKTISSPQGNKNKFFAAAQESARKDVERAFGVLQARFAIVRGPARFWDRKTLTYIMKACIIMHNMIVEDERDQVEKEFCYDDIDESSYSTISHEETIEMRESIRRHHRPRNPVAHSQLQLDLVEHLWKIHGEK